MSTPLVTVIVITYNSAREIEACLRSVQDRAHVAIETIVVDNASCDDTVARVRASYPNAFLQSNAENVGFSRANNQALAVARGRYVLFLNPDTELSPGALAGMVLALEKNRRCAAVGPRLVNPDGRVWRVSARRLPTLWTELCQLAGLDRLYPSSRLFGWKYYAPWDRGSDRDVECLCGAALLARLADVRRIGGFDESVPLFLDDMDLCKRLGMLGTVRYLHQCEVLHHHDASGAQQPRPVIERMALQAVFRYFGKHRSRWYALLYALMVGGLGGTALLLAVALRVAGRARAASLVGRRGGTLVAWFAGRKSGPWTLERRPPTDGRRDHLLSPHLGGGGKDGDTGMGRVVRR